MVKSICCFLLLVVCAFYSKGQNKTADFLLDNYDYKPAIVSYLKHYNTYNQKQKADVAFKLAYAYSRLQKPDSAAFWYQEATLQGTQNSEVYFLLGQTYRQLEKYDSAQAAFNKYFELTQDTLGKTFADFAKSFAQKKTNNDQGLVMPVWPLTTLNTEASEITPMVKDGKLLFASDRGDGQNYDYFRSDCGALAEKPEVLLKSLTAPVVQLEQRVAFKHQDAAAVSCCNDSMVFFSRTFNKKFGKWYMTSGNFSGQNIPTYSVGLFYIKLLANGVWSDAIPIKEINGANYSVGHPAVTKDGRMLIFASDKPGGLGGTDLYLSTLSDDGVWSEPVNLGFEVNSPQDELFPSFANDTVLYFSTNGRPGPGGLDLYRAAWRPKTGFNLAQLMPLGVNSAGDDFGLCFVDSVCSRGFLTSNRKGGKGGDDLYFFELIQPKRPFKLLAKAVSKNTNEPLSGVSFVTSDTKTLLGVSGADGMFTYESDDSLTSWILADKEFYMPVNKVCNFLDRKADLTFEMKPIYRLDGVVATLGNEGALLPLKGAAIQVFNEKDSAAILYRANTEATGAFRINDFAPGNYAVRAQAAGYITITKNIVAANEAGVTQVKFLLDSLKKDAVFELRNIYYDLNKWNVREDAAVVLKAFAQVLKDNPTMKVQLGSYTDSRGGMAFNQTLSEKRAKAVVEYLEALGIPKQRLSFKGYGATQLVNGCTRNVRCSEDKHQENRRTVFKIVE